MARGGEIKMKLGSFGLAILISFGSISASTADDISFSQLSKMKDDATRIGTFLAVLSDCNSDERYIRTLKESISSLGLDFDILSADEAKEIIVNSLEQSGLDVEKLTILDDIIRARQGEISGEVLAALQADTLSASYAEATSLCVKVTAFSPLIKSPNDLPDDAPGRMAYYAKVSPLGQ
jgi:hypothetical protein